MSHSVEKISDHLQEVATGNTVQADNTITINQSISTISNEFDRIGEMIK
ncbi:hypothetical protein [Halalkalibacter alkalisediminis]|uniref:Methyl-accepting chemotaxis protein n=1 Tax=Halalkalibacter alkalisediminis TaxID=935616 RepID=A0ABV6NHU5_9BACI|nr:hypothetical protein [Halalkalibacter alkalisediminis]